MGWTISLSLRHGLHAEFGTDLASYPGGTEDNFLGD
jgi:hypothetical protein